MPFDTPLQIPAIIPVAKQLLQLLGRSRAASLIFLQQAKLKQEIVGQMTLLLVLLFLSKPLIHHRHLRVAVSALTAAGQ